MSTFGKWTSPRHVETAYVDHLVKWGETFIAEAERQFGIPAQSLPVPERGQFTVRREVFEKWPEDKTPCVLLLAPGLTDRPRKEVDKTLTAPVGMALGIVASSLHPGAAGEIAQVLGVAFKEAMLLLPPEGIKVDSIDLLDERYTDVDPTKERSVGTARVIFRIWVREWASYRGGPFDRNEPPADPYEVPPATPTVDPNKLFLSIQHTTPEED